MMKHRIILLAFIILSACTQREQPKNQSVVIENKVPDSLLIRPGQSIGKIKIGDDAQALLKLYGQPDQQDAAMGSAGYTWFAKHDISAYRISVYGHRNFGGVDESVLKIKKILITSPDYTTAKGVYTGMSMEDINKRYRLTENNKYIVKGKVIRVLADIGKGISFDIDSLTKKCTAISIFKPGDTAIVNINMY